MSEDAADDLPARAAAELGEPVAVYAVGPGRVRVKLAVAGGLVLYGVVANYLWWVAGPARFDHHILLVLFGPPISAVSVLRHLARSRGLHVSVYPTGLFRVQGAEVEAYPWADVDEVRVRSDRGEPRFEYDDDDRVTACWVDVEPPLVKFWDAGLTVHRADGTEVTFTPALAGYAELAERIQRETFAAHWPGVRVRLAAGDAVAFGKFEADADGLWFGEQRLPWASVTGAEVAHRNLSVKRAGGWRAWAVADLADVPNPHLLLAVIEEMRGG